MAQDADIKISERKEEDIQRQLQKFKDSYYKINTNQAPSTTWI